MTTITQTRKDDTFESVAILAGIPTLIAAWVASAVLVGAAGAFVIWKLYGWFTVPLGAPTINYWHMWGLMMIFGIVTMPLKSSTDEPFKASKTIARWGGQLVGLACVLLLGWLIHGMI